MTKQIKNNLRSLENENIVPFRTDKGQNGNQKRGQETKINVESNDSIKDREDLQRSEEKTTQHRNAFLKLDLDAIALRMKKDLADRCCCADVPCVSTIKEYCESR